MAYEHNSDLLAVTKVIPHRAPHLWLDGVTECEPGHSAEGFWTPGPEHFMGHFNDELEVLPGVKQVEAGAQLGAYMMMSEAPGETIPLFASIESVEFKAPVFPGDTLILAGETIERKGSGFKGLGRVSVDGVVTCEMVISAAIFPQKLGIKVVNRQRRGPVKTFDSVTQSWTIAGE